MSISGKCCWICAHESKRNSLVLLLPLALCTTEIAGPRCRLASESKTAPGAGYGPMVPRIPIAPECHSISVTTCCQPGGSGHQRAPAPVSVWSRSTAQRDSARLSRSRPGPAMLAHLLWVPAWPAGECH